MRALLLSALLAGVIIVALLWGRFSGSRPVETIPASELQKKYDLYAENRPIIKLNPQTVPERLRDLIPLAEKWGIEDDTIRSDFEHKAGLPEKEEFMRLMRGRTADIKVWLDSFDEKLKSPPPAAAETFRYMTLALTEMNLWPD